MISEAKSRFNVAEIGLSASLRVILAIAAKDIRETIQNKTILSIMLGTLILVLSGVAMPIILGLTNLPPMAAIYDPAGSELIKPLTRSREFRLIPQSSLDELKISIAENERMTLGLLIPPDFDEKVVAGEAIKVEGYLLHSQGAAKGAELVDFFEAQLSNATGGVAVLIQPLQTVYVPLEANGQPMMAITTFIIALIVMGTFLTPYLMIEEKEKHTLEALLVSPASFTQVAGGEAIAGLVYCLAAAVVLLAFNFRLVHLWGIMLVAILAGSFFSVALGMLVGMFFENQASMNMVLGVVLLVLLVPTIFSTFSISNLPPIVESLIHLLPTSAWMMLLRISFAESIPLDIFLPNLSILVVCVLLVLVLVVWRLRQYVA